MASKVFVDSDVVIDFFTDREPFANPASEIFDLADKGHLEIYISAVSINNIYYVLRKQLGHGNAVNIIEELLDMCQIIGTTKSEILIGLKSNFKDFEDSVQYASALTVKNLEAILTRNIRDFKSSDIAVLTSLQYLKLKG